MAKQENLSQFIRKELLNDPKVTLEQIAERWKKVGNGETKPNDGLLSVAKSGLRKKYGVKDLADLQKPKGGVNVSALVRVLLQKNLDNAGVTNQLAKDGLSCDSSLVVQLRKEKPKEAVTFPKGSPDPNQDKGPRARIKPKQRRKLKPKAVQVQVPTNGEWSLNELEDIFDGAMNHARLKKDSEMVDFLRQARRRAIRMYS